MNYFDRLSAILMRYPDIESALSWRPMESAPIDGTWIIVCTTHGKTEPARYCPDGDFKDRWGRDNVRFNCLGWLPITVAAPPLDHRVQPNR